ncbi:type II secretion system protein M [Aquincola sp. S2]|uniref:Type II secretion system protein M n=1 Tax=Pseudaquabacterium terrae TaxID=2732868 RepID=A0ABX2EDN5_9BURK|nr:type II secretion system protein GspM [Aquabacterium terrae]NRF66583.1 type II secretion system protein M [Aquabacterium terrae]
MNVRAWRDQLSAAWRERSERERRMVLVAGLVLGAYLLWLATTPAWRTLRSAPARQEALDAQWQVMQRLAAEAQALRAVPPLPADQARTALQASAGRLGDAAKLVLQGDRAVLTVSGLPAEQLAGWLTEVRINTRARVIESQLQRTPQGTYAGSVVLALGTPP